MAIDINDIYFELRILFQIQYWYSAMLKCVIAKIFMQFKFHVSRDRGLKRSASVRRVGEVIGSIQIVPTATMSEV